MVAPQSLHALLSTITQTIFIYIYLHMARSSKLNYNITIFNGFWVLFWSLSQ